jgi:hypothetical protein
MAAAILATHTVGARGEGEAELRQLEHWATLPLLRIMPLISSAAGRCVCVCGVCLGGGVCRGGHFSLIIYFASFGPFPWSLHALLFLGLRVRLGVNCAPIFQVQNHDPMPSLPPPPPTCRNSTVLAYLMRSLHNCDPEDVSFFLPQLVQVHIRTAFDIRIACERCLRTAFERRLSDVILGPRSKRRKLTSLPTLPGMLRGRVLSRAQRIGRPPQPAVPFASTQSMPCFFSTPSTRRCCALTPTATSCATSWMGLLPPPTLPTCSCASCGLRAPPRPRPSTQW